ncbi:MAG: hypothetical protein JSS24_11395 [Proteobacteria bacterium]|nr:hypothetical protein [Pseudomonadota bacterium]
MNRILRRAIDLAAGARLHVFDTLHHAVAMQNENAVLVTADQRYWSATRQDSSVVLLQDWEQAPGCQP